MLIMCPGCGAEFELAETRLKLETQRIRCFYCKEKFTVTTDPEQRRGDTLFVNPATIMVGLAEKPRKSARMRQEEAEANRRSRVKDGGEDPNDQVLMSEYGLIPLHITPRQKANLLLKTGWYGDLSQDDHKELNTYWQLYKANIGTFLFKMYDHNPYMCLIAKGSVRLVLEQSPRPGEELKEEDRYQDVLKLGVNNSFGENALFGRVCNRAVSAIAAEESYIFVMTKKRFSRLFENKPEIYRHMVNCFMDLYRLRFQNEASYRTEYICNKK